MQFLKQQFFFNDFDAFAEQIDIVDIRHAQLEKGDFSGHLTQLMHGPVILGIHKMNQTILQQGSSINGYTTFLIPLNMEQDISWRKQRLTGLCIGIYKDGMEHHSITSSNFYFAQVSIKNDFLYKTLSRPEFETTRGLINSEEVIEIDRVNADLIRRMIIGICNAIQPDLELMRIDLPFLILDSIKATSQNARLYSPAKRDVTFFKAINYINLNIEKKINIQDICRATGLSERSIRYIFQDKAGLSPKRYINNLRLNKLRYEIKFKGAQNNIGDLACKWGFWHSGQFAFDYERLFGELPSESIRM